MPITVVNKNQAEFDVYIGRPSIFGNPFVIGRDGDREAVIRQYRAYFLTRVATDTQFRRAVLALQGKRLGCYCKPLACHGDIIAEWANRQGQERAKTRGETGSQNP
jgi:hypothetical protein